MSKMTGDGTYIYLANENGIQKITIADSTSVTLTPGNIFEVLLYANSTLYAATQGTLYIIDTSTGAELPAGRITGIRDMCMLDADELCLMTQSSIIRYNVLGGTYTYIRKDVN